MEFINGFTAAGIGGAITPRHQNLILFPTEKCNFRCTYCYEDFELGKMDGKLRRAIKLFLDRRIPKIETLNFQWFGGEPLLASDVMIEISEHAFNLCEKHNVRFTGGMTTNGYLLTTEMARKMIALKQDFYQISLDGYGEEHDKTRVRADGRGTFDVVWANVLGLKTLDLNFEALLRIHLHRDKKESLEVLMREIATQIGTDPRFRLEFQHLRNLGGDGKIEKAFSFAEAAEMEQHLRQILDEALFPRAATSSEAVAAVKPVAMEQKKPKAESAGSQRASEMTNPDEPYICYAAKPNSFMIRSNGRLGKCTVALSDPRNDIGYIDDDGKIIVNSDKLAPWQRGIEDNDPDTAGCPMHGLPASDLPSPWPKGVDPQVVTFHKRSTNKEKTAS